ncbi:hypothetical protein D3C73_1558850 [compost metagenome]
MIPVKRATLMDAAANMEINFLLFANGIFMRSLLRFGCFLILAGKPDTVPSIVKPIASR